MQSDFYQKGLLESSGWLQWRKSAASSVLTVGWQFGRQKATNGRILLLFLSSDFSCIDYNQYRLRFLLKQFNDSSLWGRGRRRSVSSIGFGDRFWWLIL